MRFYSAQSLPVTLWRFKARSIPAATAWVSGALLLGAGAPVCRGETNNPVFNGPTIPDFSLSLIRVFGALALVLALFFAGLWCLRNWQRFLSRQGHPAKLQVLEVRALGHRQTLYVVAYENCRLLVAASPTGVNLVSHLPPATETEGPTAAAPIGSFSQQLRQILPSS